MTLGMIQLLVIGFEGNQFKGEIIPELTSIREKGLARIIDLVFVMKDEPGNVTTVQASDLSEDEKVQLGMTAGALFGLGAGGVDGAMTGAVAGAEAALEGDFGITDEDIEEIAADVPNNSSALVLLFENLWSLPFKQAILNANGRLLGNWIIQPEFFVEMGAEYAATHAGAQPAS